MSRKVSYGDDVRLPIPPGYQPDVPVCILDPTVASYRMKTINEVPPVPARSKKPKCCESDLGEFEIIPELEGVP